MSVLSNDFKHFFLQTKEPTNWSDLDNAPVTDRWVGCCCIIEGVGVEM